MLMSAALADEVILLDGARDGESNGVVVACDVALHSKSFAGISGKDPPMVKSATDQ